LVNVALQLKLLGNPEIHLAGKPVAVTLAGKAQAILYYLAVTGQPQSRAALATLLWGDMPEADARGNLRKTLAGLRQSFGDYLDLDGQTVSFKPGGAYWVDVTEFVAKVGIFSASADAAQLQEAVELYQGDFLNGFYVRHAPDFETWMLAEQARLRELVIQALHTLATHYAEQGELAQGSGYIRRLLSLEPWREEAHRQLMWLLAQDSKRGAALAQYDICRRVLAEELGVEPGPETVHLYERIRDGELSPAAQKSQDIIASPATGAARPVLRRQSASSLPSQPTIFIGREKELADIIRRLTDRDCRLLTLVGPGGIGKTRLAIQTAQAFIDSQPGAEFFADGVIFVPLAAVESTPGMVSAIAEAAQVSFYSNMPSRQQLLDHLRQKELLLVLDNLEHLLSPLEDGAAELIAEILAAAPRVKILVTSREAVNLQEAWFHPVEGLSFPAPASERESAQGQEEDGLEKYDAVRLFVQSAQRTRMDFSLARERDHITRICQLVEGMPLAIELAATWLKVLPAAKIVQEIENNLDILSARLQNLPERHRSVRAAFEQSWRLLTQAERDVLQRLSVFRGSFDQAAAEQVAGATLMTLAILVEKSLLRVTAQGRYHMHELLRQFAAEKLVTSGEEGLPAYQQHSSYYLDFLLKQEKRLVGKEQRQALDEIGQEIDNIRTAWHWATAQDNLEIIRQAAVPLYTFYQIRSRYQEGHDIFAGGVRQLEQAGDLANRPNFEPVLAMLKARMGAFYYLRGEYEPAMQHLQASLLAAGSPAERAFVHCLLGNVTRLQGNRAMAEEHLGKGLAINREIGDLNGVLEALAGLTDVAGSFGEYETGKRLASESLAISRQLERPDQVARVLCSLAWSTSCLGAYGEAERYYRESLAISQEIGDKNGIALALEFIGWVAWCIGGDRTAEAAGYYEQAITIFREIGEQSKLSMCLADLALLLCDLGSYRQAQQHSQEAFAITKMTGNLGLMAYSLYCLGAATCGLGDFYASRKYLLNSLQTAWGSRIYDHSLNALFFWAKLLVKAGDGVEPLGGGPAEASTPYAPDETIGSITENLETDLSAPIITRALELLALILHHRATWQVIKDRAAAFKAEVEAQLPADIVTQFNTQPKSQSLEAAVTEILAEVE
jgi:DNA-binding SARP family transcriptional activator/predicted ATPase